MDSCILIRSRVRMIIGGFRMNDAPDDSCLMGPLLCNCSPRQRRLNPKLNSFKTDGSLYAQEKQNPPSRSLSEGLLVLAVAPRCLSCHNCLLSDHDLLRREMTQATLAWIMTQTHQHNAPAWQTSHAQIEPPAPSPLCLRSLCL